MTPKNNRPLKLISGSSNRPLAAKIAKHLGIQLSNSLISTFRDGESQIEIHDNMRGCDVFVLQSHCPPVNHSIMEQYLILDALKRSTCWNVTAVIPYFGYARQDRKIKPRVPISAKAIANIFTIGGVGRILTIDLHSGQTQGFFECPVDNLYGSKIFIDHIKERLLENTVLLSPDAGGTERVYQYAKALNLPMATSYKKRSAPNKIEKMIILGNVEGMHVIVVDDMIDTANTLCRIATLAMNSGAQSVTCYGTHGLFSGHAADLIQESPISKIYVLDTLTPPTSVNIDSIDCITNKVEYVESAPLLGEAIRNIHCESSVSCLF